VKDKNDEQNSNYNERNYSCTPNVKLKVSAYIFCPHFILYSVSKCYYETRQFTRLHYFSRTGNIVLFLEAKVDHMLYYKNIESLESPI
jgi:hypothetical protein